MKDYVCILILNNYDCTINKSKALLQCHVCNPGHKSILTNLQFSFVSQHVIKIHVQLITWKDPLFATFKRRHSF